MLVDLGLDGGGAGHGGLWSHQRGGRPKRMAGDLPERLEQGRTDAAVGDQPVEFLQVALLLGGHSRDRAGTGVAVAEHGELRSEEHTSELQSLMRISYAVFCLKKKKKTDSKQKERAI